MSHPPPSSSTLVRRSGLEHVHLELGAKLVEFGGWSMPLSYPQGTISEHMACRTDAALFDVSHLGTVEVRGKGSFDLLQRQLTNDLGKISQGRAQYTHLLDVQDASVLDDIIVWWIEEDLFHVMPNASNTDRVLDAIGGTDITDRRAVIALQGPRARQVLATLSPEAAAVGRFRVERIEWRSADLLAAGTGYTGEDGVEVAVPLEVAEALWRALVDAGATPAGLGARDTLRLEAGLPLHGHELGPGITPLQAGLEWVVGWDKGPFRGRDPLEHEKRRGPARLLRGIVTDGRQPPRQGSSVLHREKAAGVVTSGNFSPVLQCGVALAFIDSRCELHPGDPVEVETRGRRLSARLHALPFVERTPSANHSR